MSAYHSILMGWSAVMAGINSSTCIVCVTRTKIDLDWGVVECGTKCAKDYKERL